MTWPTQSRSRRRTTSRATLVYRQTSGLPGAVYAPHSSWFAVDLRLHGVTAGDVTVGITASDKIGLEVRGAIAVTIEASATVGRAPLISRERVHETIARHGQPVVLVGGATGVAYNFLAQVNAGGLSLSTGTSALGLGAVPVAIDAPVFLTLSDVDFQSVASERDLELLSVNRLGAVALAWSVDNGVFLFQGERWAIVGVERQIDAGHLLSHRFTLEQDVSLTASPTPDPQPVTETPDPTAPTAVGVWTIRVVEFTEAGGYLSPHGTSGDMSVYAGTPETDVSSDWRYPASILAASSMRATIAGTAYTWTVNRGAARKPFLVNGVYVLYYQWRGDTVSPSRPSLDAVWTLHQLLEFLDASGNVITDGPVFPNAPTLAVVSATETASHSKRGQRRLRLTSPPGSPRPTSCQPTP